MKHIGFLLIFYGSLFLGSCAPKTDSKKHFSLHLFMEPQHLDPARSHASSASYFFYNILRGLYKINQHNEVVEEGGRCQWQNPLLLHCQVFKAQWSNGDKLTSHDYIRQFQHLINPQVGSPRAHLLNDVKNAKKILAGSVAPHSLGVRPLNDQEFLVEFDNVDHEFLYKLASTALYPKHRSMVTKVENFKGFIGNGPYQIKEWHAGKELLLKPNLLYQRGHSQRPSLQFLFLDDEMTAFRLYEKKKLSFLRRVPSQMIKIYQNRKDFYQVPMLRFDYIGFGSDLLKYPNLRKALTQSIDYEKLRVILGGLERPGCPSIPKKWLVNQTCYAFTPQIAKNQLSHLPQPVRQRTWGFYLSHLGGLDTKKQGEFIQSQWKNNLDISIEVNQVEQKVFLSQLRKKPFEIFRKGVGLDRPTCYNALQTFSADSSRNYLQFQDSQFSNLLMLMKREKPNSQTYRALCQKTMDHLLSLHRFIPMGEMHFTILASAEFQGWTLNGLNQLDLSQLTPRLK